MLLSMLSYIAKMKSETLCIHIRNENSVTLCLVYVPPNSPESYMATFLTSYISTTVCHSNNKYIQ